MNQSDFYYVNIFHQKNQNSFFECKISLKIRQMSFIMQSIRLKYVFNFLQEFINLLNLSKILGLQERSTIMVRYLNHSLLFLFFIIISASQTTNEVKKQDIELDKLYNITLEKGQTKTYTVTIKDLKTDMSLFVETVSPTYDPYEIPLVLLKSENHFSQSCTEETNQFLGICQVQFQKLKEGQKFDIQIKCIQKCNLKLDAFLSDTLELDFGQKVEIYSQKTVDTLQSFKIQVPQNLNFTDIALIATFLNEDTIEQGAQMYVNVGNDSKKIPSSQNYMFKGRDVWGDGIGVFISGKQIKAGQWITVLLVVGKGVQIQFYTQAANGKTFDIILNTAYRDFTTSDETKLYVLDIYGKDPNTTASLLENRTVQIVFVVFSGMPSVKVSFEPTFNTYLDNYDVQGTFSYLITPEIRKKQKFTGKIYVQVHSYWTSNYYINTFTVSDRFYQMTDGVSQLNRAQPGQIQNYIYESYIVINANQTETESYRVKVEIMQGVADLGMRRCLSMEKDGSLDCLIPNLQALQDKSLKESFNELNVTLKKEWDAYELLFDYNVSLCSVYKDFKEFKVYNCDFQIIIFPAPKANKTLVYSITMIQARQQAELKQSYFYKDYIYPGAYHYYDFNLPSLDNVQEVTFFMTVINGDAGLIGTTNPKFQYMEFSDAVSNEDVMYSFFNTLTFTKDKLAKQFFLAVYAYEATDLTMNVIVKRKGQSKNDSSSSNQTQTQITKLSLVQGLTQQYTLSNGTSMIDFTFTARNAQNITIEIIEIQGSVTFYIQKQGTNQNIACTNKVQPGELKCVFLPQEKAKYIIHVNGTQKDIQSFSISYYYLSSCKKFLFNLPQFVYLSAQQTQCSNYSIIDTSKSLQILTSFSTIDLLTTEVKFKAIFNDNHTIEFTGRSKVIPSDELKEFCKDSNTSNCQMKLEYKGDMEISSKFYFVVQQIGKQMVLFDGIVRKIVDQKMSQTKGKFFYYEVTSMKDSIKIFTTNKDNIGYYIGAKFVNMSQFLSSPDDLYLPFRENLTNKLDNAYQTFLVPQKGTSMIQIESQKFAKNCTACVVLISVYGLQKQSNDANIFQIQVTQTQSFISLGEQQMGFLSEDEIYMYDVYGNPDGESLLTIRDFLKESSKQKDCFSVTIWQAGIPNSIPVTSGYFIIPKSTYAYRVFVQNVAEDICAYQISLSSLAKPVTEINPFIPVEVKIANRQIKYFLYNHPSNETFQILNYVKSGDVKIYANKVDANETIEKLMQKNIEMFGFASHSGDSFLQVLNTSKNFAPSSYYLIALKGDPVLVSQMAIVKGQMAIGLTSYGILKQTLNKNEKETYAYYSIFDFNVSIPLLFGQLRVTLITPDKKTFYNQTIKTSTEIIVPKPITAEGQYIDYFNENSLFIINVEAVKDSSYYISIKKKNVSLRMYEGIPINIVLTKQARTIEFVNGNSDDNVTMILQVKEDIPAEFDFGVSAEVMKDGQVSSSKIGSPVIKRSQKSFNYMFKSIKGTYFISMNATSNVTVSMILVKKKLTHLMSSNANLFTEKGTFEIYTPGNNLMIVVDSCLGEVQVKASQKYQALTDSSKSSPVLLEHANYGGHYVVTAQNVEGEYFVQVNPKNSKKDSNMLYIISYYYYSKLDDMPYKKIDIDPEISYQLANDKIIFELEPVKQLSSKMKFKITPTYTLYISPLSNVTTMNSRCDLSLGFIYSTSITPNATDDPSESIKFPIDFKTLANAVGEKTEVYYVSAKVKVKIQGENMVSDYIPYIDLAYSKLQLTQSTHTIEFKSETTSNVKYIMLWVVIPIIISLVLFVLALKFCIRKYKMLYPDKLVEEDREMGESEGQMQDTINNKPVDALTST